MMIRVYKDTAKFMFLCWMWMREQGADVGSLNQYFRNGARKPRDRNEGDRAQAFRNQLNESGFGYEANLSDMIQEMGEQIAKADSPNADASIIDEIVRILRLPYARNNINADHLKLLKRAILMPDEVAALNASLNDIEGRCTACNRVFSSGEMVTYQKDEQRRGDTTPSIYCTICVPPDFARCGECGETHPSTKNLRAILRGSKTKCSKLEEENRLQREAQQGAREPNDVVVRIRQGAPVAQVAGRAGMAAQPVQPAQPDRADNDFLQNLAQAAQEDRNIRERERLERVERQVFRRNWEDEVVHRRPRPARIVAPWNPLPAAPALPPPDRLVDEGPFNNPDDNGEGRDR